MPNTLADVKKAITEDMTSEQREAALNKVLKDVALSREINKHFEASILLKRRKDGEEAIEKYMERKGKSFENKIAPTETRSKRAKAMEADMERRKKLIYNEDGTVNDNFKAILGKTESEIEERAEKMYSSKYGIDVPDTITVAGKEVDTVQHLVKLQDDIDALAEKAKGTVDGSAEKLKWGDKLVEMEHILDDIQQAQKSYKKEAQVWKSVLQDQYKSGDYFGAAGQLMSGIIDVASSPVLKSLKASLDASYALRQGLKVLSSNPSIYKKNVLATGNVWKNSLNKDAEKKLVDAFKADMMTKDIYQDAVNSGLAIGVIEDFFPNSPVSKLPLFKASEDTFLMFSQGSRMDLFESYVNLYKQTHGVKPTQEIMKGFAKVANSVTGRGGLSVFEPAAGALNKIFFSARYQTANINTVRHAFTGTIHPEARKIAQRNLGRHLTLIGGALSVASLAGMNVGWDPRETNFGKVQFPGSKKWVDLTGGLASYVAHPIRATVKTFGKQKFGQDTGLDVLVDFLKGKLAPSPAALRDYYEQRDYSGQVPTIVSTARNLFIPITADNAAKSLVDGYQNQDAMFMLLESIGAGLSQPKENKNRFKPEDYIK